VPKNKTMAKIQVFFFNFKNNIIIEKYNFLKIKAWKSSVYLKILARTFIYRENSSIVPAFYIKKCKYYDIL